MNRYQEGQIFLDKLLSLYQKNQNKGISLNCKVRLQRNRFHRKKKMNCAKKIFKAFDLFSTSQFLRFQKEGEYKTASGGICSMIVIVVFMTLFMSTAIQTINMEIITWTSTSQLQFDPGETIVSVDPPTNPFMFAVKLLGINLNDNTRFFDVFIVEREYINGMYETTPKYVDMVPCTTQHFSLTDNIKQSTASLGIHQWKCPPLGYNFSVKGKFTSADMKLLEVRLTKCNASRDPSRPCASDALIDMYEAAFEQFIIALYVVNPLINPGDQQYLSYYIEDKNYFKFTRKLGSDSNGRIEDYKIETDVSLLPYAKNVVDQGVIITQTFQNIAFEVTNDRYASFFFMKSARSTSYARSFNKLDTFFSYVGGLVGTILGLMFVVASFTSMSYELQLAERLYRYTEERYNDFSSFNLLSYALFVAYQIVKIFGIGKKWETMKQLQTCSEQVARQLDVQLMLERLLFLQRSTQILLEQHQIHGLHMHRLDTLKEIKKRRKRYSLGQQDSSDDEQVSKQKTDNNMNASNALSNASNPQLLIFQGNNNIKILNDSPSRNQIQLQQAAPDEQDYSKKVVLQLREESLKGNHISRRILEGIEAIQPTMTKLQDNSSEVVKIDPVEFQFIN